VYVVDWGFAPRNQTERTKAGQVWPARTTRNPWYKCVFIGARGSARFPEEATAALTIDGTTCSVKTGR